MTKAFRHKGSYILESKKNRHGWLCKENNMNLLKNWFQNSSINVFAYPHLQEFIIKEDNHNCPECIIRLSMHIQMQSTADLVRLVKENKR